MKKIQLWIGLALLAVAVIAVVAYEYTQNSAMGASMGALFLLLFPFSFIVGLILVVLSLEQLYRMKHPREIGSHASFHLADAASKIEKKDFNKPPKNGINFEALGLIVLIFIITVPLFSFWNQYATYQRDVGKEMDYVCFNNDCNYISPDKYSVNFAGTCLTRTDLGSPVQRCGGTIQITKYPPESFWSWLANSSSSSTGSTYDGYQPPN